MGPLLVNAVCADSCLAARPGKYDGLLRLIDGYASLCLPSAQLLAPNMRCPGRVSSCASLSGYHGSGRFNL